MSSELHAWRDGAHVATFTRSGAKTELHYDDPASPSLSLSLANGRRHNTRAAAFWLDGLLPENPRMRARLAARHRADASDTFSLLSAAGADVAGAISLLPPDRVPGDRDDQPSLVTEEQLRASIASIRAGHGPTDVVAGQRMSLAGAQDKFSLAHVGEQWFTPTAALPSTHIIKPATDRNLGLDRLERAALDLARDAGLDAARADLHAGAFIVERFDRTITRTGVRRRHLEDLTQALGLPPGTKYGVQAKHIIELLRDHTNDEQVYRFIEQLAFNTHLGNADAHAKNYSLFLDTTIPTLTPLYDTVPIAAFPNYDQELAMKIAGARFAAEATVQHWAKLARTTGLDTDRVTHIATHIANAISKHAPHHHLAPVIPTSAMVHTTPPPPATHPTPGPVEQAHPASGDAGSLGDVWVEPHMRNGHHVAGHYRARPHRH